MKNNVIYFIFSLLTLFSISCTELTEIRTGDNDTSYFIVEGILDNIPNKRQVIKLSKSTDYFSNGNDTIPPVTGATVIVNDGYEDFCFKEDNEMGNYYSPEGFSVEIGRTYTLRITATDDDGNIKEYSSKSTMIEPGCELERIDYKNVLDSTYAIGIWMQDKPQISNYLLMTAVNGQMRPLSESISLNDLYFNGQYITGFPIMVLMQTWKEYNAGKAYAKPLETGDVISVFLYTVTDDFENFYSSYLLNSATSIPLISSQPANAPTNISGDNAAGLFTTMSVLMTSCVVDDPNRTEFNY